jgi:hypothetical protein
LSGGVFHAQERRPRRAAIIGIGRAPAAPADDEGDTVAGNPACAVNHFLHNGTQVGSVLDGVDRAPNWNIIPAHHSSRGRPRADVIGGAREGCRVICRFAADGQRSRLAMNFIDCKFDVSIGDGSALRDGEIVEADANNLQSQAVNVIDQLKIGTVKAHVTITHPLLRIVVRG